MDANDGKQCYQVTKAKKKKEINVIKEYPVKPFNGKGVLFFLLLSSFILLARI